MTANILYDRGDVAALVEQAKVDDVDVLAVQELTAGALAALDAAGVDGLLPFRVVHPAGHGNGSGAVQPAPADPGRRRRPARRHPCGMLQAGATVHVPDAGPVDVESAHPCAPRPGHTACWARDLAAQPPAGGDVPRVLLGDFNATLDHGPLRRLLRAGYRDAAAVRGRGLAPTWPFLRWRGTAGGAVGDPRPRPRRPAHRRRGRRHPGHARQRPPGRLRRAAPTNSLRRIVYCSATHPPKE